jgi:hypothetical protein
MNPTDPTASLRRTACTLLIASAAAMAAGRILATERVYEPNLHRPETPTGGDIRPAWPRTRPNPMPTFSSNDRSRWATVRALVDEGTYVVGRRDRQTVLASALAGLGATEVLPLAVVLSAGYRARIDSDRGIIFEDGWQSVDKVLHPARLEFYSSKPPLLSTLVAGEYWVVEKLTGWTLRDNPFEVVRLILITINVLPLILYLWLLARVAERSSSSDWARLFVVTAGAFGTLVTPFVITFNNHSVAVVTTMVTLAAALRIWSGPAPGWLYALAGFSAGFTACNELPALALAAGLFLVLLVRSPGKTLLLYVPAALLPAAALLGTNYAALGQFRPAYSEFGGPWYQYEGSHWREVPGVVRRGIDFAKNTESRATYAFHLLLGHHGLFSLTPILLLTGLGLALRLLPPRRPPPERPFASGESPPDRGLPWFLFPATLALSVVVVGFYLVKSDNYGGWSAGPRWLMWLTPLWLVTMLPALEWLEKRRGGRAVAVGLLALSVLSASYPAWNPWRQPWIYHLLDAHGWIPY